MNPASEIQQPHAPPQVLQPPRSSFSCDRHPVENFTGFCPSCLCERLTTLDQSAAATSSSRRNSTSSSSAAAALKSLFRAPASSVSKSSFLPELRRSKSFSATKNDGLGFPAGGFEPQRKSCDVRGRNTLWSLFSIHDENNSINNINNNTNKQNGAVLETNREESEEEDEIHENDVVLEEEVNVNGIVEETVENEVTALSDLKEEVTEITESILKPMKDHIDLDTQSKKSTRSNFWSAASVLSKKWQKWRRKQKKDDDDVTRTGVVLSSSCNTLPVEKKSLLKSNNKYRDTQSEIADYGFGRRSCEYDAGRFSLDAGRVSFDDPRYSFDEPRASWDGYLIGRTFPRLPPMVEDDVPVVNVARCDSQIPVEDGEGPVGSGMGRVCLDENGDVPGGSVQTREYYLDSSSSKRRKSLDRSNSIRRMAAGVVAELDSNSRGTMPVVVPSINVENEAPRVSNCNSLRDDCGSETFELGFRDGDRDRDRDRDNGVVPIGVGKKEMKKPRKWRWKLWGFIHRRNSKDDDEEDRCSSVSGVGRSYAESWQDLRTNGDNGGINVNRNVFRSNSSVSWRSSSLRKTNPNVNGSLAFGNGNVIGNGKSRRGADEFVLERNRSARYSPNHIDNGLLRFYLAPLSSSRRGGIGISTGKSKPTSNSHSIARSMLRLY